MESNKSCTSEKYDIDSRYGYIRGYSLITLVNLFGTEGGVKIISVR